MKTKYIQTILILSFFSLFAFTSIAYSGFLKGLLGKKVSWKMEKSFGKMTKSQMKSEYGFIEDPLLQKYIEQMGTSLVNVSDRKDIPYEFHIVDTDEINAFAAPGGFLFVTKGLLNLSDSDDEVATVMGHEVGHVAAHHSWKNIERGILTWGGLEILEDKTNKQTALIGGIATALMQLHYSREDEYQADQLGVKYSFAANYDPNTMEQFFAKLEKKHKSGNLSRIEVALSSHPKTTNRIGTTKTYPETSPKNVSAIIKIAGSYTGRFYFYDAIGKYETALAIEPNNIDALNGLAFAKLSLGEYADASSNFTKVLQIDPQNKFAAENIQNINLRKLDDQKQIEEIEQSPPASEEKLEKVRSDLIVCLSDISDIKTNIFSMTEKQTEQIQKLGLNFQNAIPSIQALGASIKKDDKRKNEVYKTGETFYAQFTNALSNLSNLNTNYMDFLAYLAEETEKLKSELTVQNTVSLTTLNLTNKLVAQLKNISVELPEKFGAVSTFTDTLTDAYKNSLTVMASLEEDLQDTSEELSRYEQIVMLENLNAESRAVEKTLEKCKEESNKLLELKTSAQINFLNLNVSILPPIEQSIYRKIFTKRFDIEQTSAKELAASGLGYGDMVLVASKSKEKNIPPQQTVQDFNSKKSILPYLSEKYGGFRGLDILLHLAENDLKHIRKKENLFDFLVCSDIDEVCEITKITGSEQSNPNIKNGAELLLDGKVNDAIRELEKGLANKPKSVYGHKLLGIAYKKTALFSEAVKQFKSALKLEPNDAQTHYFWANTYHDQERYEDAINEYKQALNVDADFLPAYLNMAYTNFKINKSDLAIENYKKTIEVKPTFYHAYNNLGLLYFLQGKKDLALAEFQKSLAINSEQPEIQAIINRSKPI